MNLGAERLRSTGQLLERPYLVLTIPNKNTLVHADDTAPLCSKVIVLLSIDVHLSIHRKDYCAENVIGLFAGKPKKIASSTSLSDCEGTSGREAAHC